VAKTKIICYLFNDFLPQMFGLAEKDDFRGITAKNAD
jgi:hypothetical protein